MFLLTVKPITVRLFFVIIMVHDYKCRQVDIVLVFLQGDFEIGEEIFIC